MESKPPIDPKKTPCRYGFIGLGIMGWGMAYNLRSFVPSSARLMVCEISEERRQQWVLQAPGPVYVGGTPKAVVEGSDIIFTMLPKGPHVWDVFTNKETGLLSADPALLKDKLFIECSTIDIETSLKVAAEVERLQAGQFVDAPVSGGVHGATNGTLSFMVGCPSEALFERVKPFLCLMGKEEKIFHCGHPSAGLATKQINNYLSCITMLGTCEAMNMGLRSGLDPQKLASVINVSTGACYNANDQNPVKGVSNVSSAANDFEGGFVTELCQGVLEMALEHGEKVGAKSVLGDVVSKFYGDAVQDDRCRGKDFRSIWKVIRDDEASESGYYSA